MAAAGSLEFESPAFTTKPTPMEDPPAVPVEWSNLPLDILITVQNNLESPDLFRSAAVCTSWRAATTSLRRDGLYTRPQAPCLLYFAAASSPRAVEINSLTDKSTYTIPLPDPPHPSPSAASSGRPTGGWSPPTLAPSSTSSTPPPANNSRSLLWPPSSIEQVTPVFDV
ncbi:hypothetical protein QOZ80_5AG0381780 [Eleusine coracana subsp. coracana]|nr:hypothetical protein QOZ80_5AG0381780 [Eleusine coracana subsp. coracana]